MYEVWIVEVEHPEEPGIWLEYDYCDGYLEAVCLAESIPENEYKNTRIVRLAGEGEIVEEEV